MISDDDLARVRQMVTSGPLLGAEIDLTYRVLALTLEPTVGRDLWTDADDLPDKRIQLLLHPVAEVAASFQERVDDRVTVLRFEPGQLPDIVAVLGEPSIDEDPFPADRPSREGWGRQSMQGSSGATDGRHRHLHLDVADGPYRLRLHATFDDVEVRGPDGQELWATDAAPHVPGGPMSNGRQLPMA